MHIVVMTSAVNVTNTGVEQTVQYTLENVIHAVEHAMVHTTLTVMLVIFQIPYKTENSASVSNSGAVRTVASLKENVWNSV
jgi:hypothetical protein